MYLFYWSWANLSSCFALLIERRARHVQFSRAIDRSYFGVKKRLICRELLAIFDASVVKMKMTFALLHFILVVCLQNCCCWISLPLSPFFLSLSFSSIYTRCLPTHHKNTRRCVLRVRDRENENESETQSGDLESLLRRASKREREINLNLFTHY